MTARPLHRAPARATRSVARCHVGRVRQVNEDRVLDRPEAALWAIADGMGGHAGGAAAATRVIVALAAVEHGASGPAFLDDIARALQEVNRSLHGGDGDRAGGSTVVALLIHDGHYACIWAGDSRAYRLRGGALQAITRDHSVVQQMVDRGTLTEAERRAHPGGNVITRAIGSEAQVKLDRETAAVADGDIFLLCSDGLLARIDESEIAMVLRDHDLDTAADRLLALSLNRGAPDNVSLVLVAAASG